MYPEIVVVVCAYTEDRWGELIAALDSLQSQTLTPKEIILVIDHNPGLFHRASQQLQGVRVVESRGARGLSGARNTGIEEANGEIVAFIDEDAIASPTWLEVLSKAFQDPRVMGVGGSILPDWINGRPKWFPQEFDWVVGCTYRGMPEGYEPVRNLIGCNMSFRREVFDSVGGFREGVGRIDTLPFGCEETELCIRARQEWPEREFMHHPAAVVWHRVPEIRSRFSYFKSRCFSEGVSKAQVTDYVGGADGLSSERRYVLKTLSTGVRRNIKLALSNRELGGLMRAGTIFIGLFLTTLGYLYGKAIPRAHMKKALSPASKKPSPMPVVQAADRSPITIQQIELSEPIPSIPSAEGGRAGTDRNFKGLIRLHSQPLGLIDLVMPSGGLTSRALASQIWNSLADKIQDHLKDDGIPTPDTLDEQGIPDPEGAGCKQRISAKSDEEPYISIVIATRDHLDSLVPCLESILALAYENYDLIVVDNAPSSNATRDFIENTYRNHPKIRYLHEDIPGLAIAHNRGLAATQAPIVAFTDDDVLVDPHWLQAIARNFLSDPKIGCVSGMIVPIELEAPSQFWIEQFGGFGKGFDRKIYDLETYRPADILFPYAAGKFGSGANMAFRMSALRAVGGFDPALGAGTLASGGDDLAAFFETITHGYRLVYEPGALVFHRHHRDYASLRKQVYGYGVGLGAFLMKTVVDKPIRFLELMAKTPSGLKYYFSSRSLKNQKKQKSFPRELSILELRGLLYGPFAYLRSRRKTAKTQGRLSFPDPGY